MSVPQLLEAAAQVIVARWRALLVLALLFAGPAALLTAAAGTRLNEVMLDVMPDLGAGVLPAAPVLTVAEFERLSGALVVLGLATLVAGVLGSIGAVGISAAVVAPRLDPRAQLGQALRRALRKVPSVLAFMIVTSAIVLATAATGLLLVSLSATISATSLTQGGPAAFAALVVSVASVVVIVYLTLRWAVAYPVMALEDAGWRNALRRSWQLSADNVWRIAGVVLASALVTLVGTAAATQLLSIVLVDVVASALGLDQMLVETLVASAVTVFLAPLAPAILAVLYVDLRVRHAAPASEPDRGRTALR
jgi:hypothetical protein